MTQERKAVGKVIRAFRKQVQFTQETLADKSGLDRSYISLLELGKYSPTIDTLLLLCQTMDVSFVELAVMLEKELAQVKNEKRLS